MVGVSWENGLAFEVRLKPAFSNDLTVECNGITEAKVVNQKGESINFSVVGENRIVFEGVAGDSYTISISNTKRLNKRRFRNKIIEIV